MELHADEPLIPPTASMQASMTSVPSTLHGRLSSRSHFQTGAFCEPELKDLRQCKAVYRNFPIDCVEDISFVHPVSRALVSEFWYTDDGDVVYDNPTDASLYKYARLITKSSVYEDIGMATISKALAVSTVIAQLQYSVKLAWLKPKKSQALILVFPVVFMLKIAVWFGFAYYRARMKLHGEQLSRDFIWEANAISKAKTLFFTWFFHLFDVPSSMTEVSSRLHINKSVQPFAVFRSHFHRAWVLGWPSKEQYDVENKSGSLVTLPVNIIFELPMVVMQSTLVSECLEISFITVFTLLVSVLTLIANLYNLVVYIQARRAFYQALKNRVSKPLRRSTTQDWIDHCQDFEMDQIIVDYKLLKTHFNEEMPASVRERAVRLGWMDAEDSADRSP
mmetsp:Transcript_41006/g.103011  ORF Transcript_41006/g.103011 Transcript_41006/m.103011 type:complete len:392 (-) Transcript_41006:122-1297(-)